MKRSEVIPHVKYVVDDNLNGRRLGEDQFAVIRCQNPPKGGRLNYPQYLYNSVLVGWNMGNKDQVQVTDFGIFTVPELLFIAVHSYLDVEIKKEEAEKLARDYLDEIGIFGCNGLHCTDDGCKLNSRPADFVIR